MRLSQYPLYKVGDLVKPNFYEKIGKIGKVEEIFYHLYKKAISYKVFLIDPDRHEVYFGDELDPVSLLEKINCVLSGELPQVMLRLSDEKEFLKCLVENYPTDISSSNLCLERRAEFNVGDEAYAFEPSASRDSLIFKRM